MVLEARHRDESNQLRGELSERLAKEDCCK